MFRALDYITSIDMSNIYNDNAQYTDDMFNGCTNIQSIKINKFKNIQLLSNIKGENINKYNLEIM